MLADRAALARTGARSERGLTTAPESRCDPGCLPFSSTATGTSPSRSASSGLVLEQLPQPDRAREPRRPRADDQDADLDPLSAGRSARRSTRAESNGGGKSDGLRSRSLALLRTSSVSFGRISCRSPTTPRSANSKIGAFGVLVDRDDQCPSPACRPCAGSRRRCRPRRRASARRSCPSGRPAPRTGTSRRRRPRASPRPRRRAPCASSSTSSKFSGPPRPRPPATITSASSIDGPSLSSCACSTIVAASREVLRARLDAPRPRPSRRVSGGSNAPERKSASRGSERPADVDVARSRRAPGACRRARRLRSTRSVRSQLRPASSRAASPAATSAASTLCREQHGVEAARRARAARARPRAAAAAAPRAARRPRRSTCCAPNSPASRGQLRRRRSRRRRPATSPPSAAAFASTPSESFCELALVVLEEDQRASQQPLLREELDDLLGARVPSSSIFAVSPRAGGSFSAQTSVREPASPTCVGVDAEVGQRRASPAASSSRP